jgi:hypothetical protein
MITMVIVHLSMDAKFMMLLSVTCMQVQLVLALCPGPLKEDPTVRPKYQSRL